MKSFESILSTTLKSIDEAVVATDEHLKITYANPVAEEMLAIPGDTLLGRDMESICRFKNGRDHTPMQCPCRELMQSGNRLILPEETYLTNAAGKNIFVRGSISPVIHNSDKRPSGVVMILRDIDRELEDEQDARLRRHFEVVSNQIRTLLIKETCPDLQSVLGHFGNSVNADHAFFCFYPLEGSLVKNAGEIIEWMKVESGKEPGKEHGKEPNKKSGKEPGPRFTPSDFSGAWWKRLMESEKPVFITNADELADEEGDEINLFGKVDIKSMALFPFQSGEQGISGIIGLNWFEKSYHCSEIEKNMLSMISELISSNVVRSKTEELLRINEERFRNLIQKSSDIISVMSTDRQFLYVSPSVEKVLGYKPEELIGTNAFSLVHQDDLPKVEDAFLKIMKESVDELVQEHRLLHKKGHWVYLESVGSDLRRDPVVGGIVINSREITNRKQVEEELIRARNAAEEMSRVKSTLLSNISHEMRTPLTGILGFASILESELGEGDAGELAARIQLSGQRLLETIESVLDLAKLESEKIEIHLENVNIVEEVRRAMEVHARFAHDKGLTCHVRSNLEELYTDIDRQLFNRVMYNLLSNAFKYTEEGKITVMVSLNETKKKKQVKIEVQDTGLGISEKFIPKIFDEFQQESSGLSRKFEGTGLGLTITRKLVELMNGSITVKSEKGAGSTFTILLPVVTGKAGATYDDGKHKTGKRSAGPPRILIVDDDFDSSVIARFYLSNDYSVETVDSGEKALERLKEKKFHLVILDINLGSGMDGITVLKKIRKNKRWASIPAIALTAHVVGGDAEYYRKHGFSDYLGKPFRKAELKKLVAPLVSE